MALGSPTPLPVDRYLPEIAAATSVKRAVIVEASPGSGKTTRIPPALLGHVKERIVVLEPRRLAARLSAERIAMELGEMPGQSVGYQMRFERVASPNTRLLFVTEGLFLRLLLDEPRLKGIGCVILDEFHERHIHSDVALTMVRRLQATHRPDLRLIVMSATLDGERLTSHLGEDQTTHFKIDAPVHPVTVEYLPKTPDGPLEALVKDAVKALLQDPRCPGHVLVFLPGAAQIRKSHEALQAVAASSGAALLELRSETPPAEQALVFKPSSRRKIILATNVAETSLTIDGVTGVVDSGLAKIAGHATWSGLPTLDVKAISQASCLQRAGRAGRTAPGIARRLYTEADFLGRPRFEKPEIQRLDLMQTLLELTAAFERLGTPKEMLETLPWLDQPALEKVASCRESLTWIGALEKDGTLTSLGREMVRLPLHPRLSRVAVEGKRRGVAPQATLAACLLNEGIRGERELSRHARLDSDVEERMDLYCAARKGDRKLSSRPQFNFRQVERLYEQLAGRSGTKDLGEPCSPYAEESLKACLLTGFPDRVAKRREQGRGGRIPLNLCQGGGAMLTETSAASHGDFLLALDAEEQSGADAASAVRVTVASAISSDLLLEDPAGFLEDRKEHEFDREALRVRAFQRTYYAKLLLEERAVAFDLAQAEEVLFKALADTWPKPFDDTAALWSYAARLAILKTCNVDTSAFPDLSGGDFALFLTSICEGKSSFAEISSKGMQAYIDELIGYEAAARLNDLAPLEITIGAGRKTNVHYEEGKTPWVASRLQDFFGTAKTPKIAGGRSSLVVHLLSPGGQALQVTQDLESFWQKTYPALRGEYQRRYPKHYWPEDPRNAEPPRPGRLRPR